MSRFIDYSYIIATIFFTVYGQIIIKWRITQLAPLPIELGGKIKYVFSLFIDPAIFSGFAAALLASMAWMAAMTKFDLSHAYPFMSLNFVVVLLLSGYFLNEPLNTQKIFGVLLIVLGTVVAARG